MNKVTKSKRASKLDRRARVAKGRENDAVRGISASKKDRGVATVSQKPLVRIMRRIKNAMHGAFPDHRLSDKELARRKYL